MPWQVKGSFQLVIWAFFCFSSAVFAESFFDATVSPVVLKDFPFSIQVEILPVFAGKTIPKTLTAQVYEVAQDGSQTSLIIQKLQPFSKSEVQTSFTLGHFALSQTGVRTLKVEVTGFSTTQNVNVQTSCIPGYLSLLPPLVTLVSSVLLQQVIVALLLGIFAGACLISLNPLVSVLRVFDHYFCGSLAGEDHAAVLLFTFLLGGTIGIVQKSGGAQGLANLCKGFMSSRKQGQLVMLGLASCIFFDDYSSILIVGNSLRSVVASCGLSVEKFAVIVHCMGTCLAGLSPISSWVGLQIGYLAGVLDQIGLGGQVDPFVAFLQTLVYRFFPLLLLAIVVLSVLLGREFGPLVEAEQKVVAAAEASTPPSSNPTGKEPLEVDAGPVPDPGPLDPKAGTPLRWINAVLPFTFVIVATMAGMLADGASALRALPPQDQPVSPSVIDLLSNCDSVKALLWASAGGFLVSTILVTAQGFLNLGEVMEAWMEGMKDVLEPQFVLVLAWALGQVVSDVGTAEFLSSTLTSGYVSAPLLPALVSVLCFATSFACGSSFGTMGIVFPLVGPLAYKLGGGDVDFLMHCFAAILAGATFGNVCSPISDTTILTCLSTGCPLAAHVATIAPYTVIAGVLSLGANVIVGYGLLTGVQVLIVGLLTALLLFVCLGKTVMGQTAPATKKLG